MNRVPTRVSPLFFAELCVSFLFYWHWIALKFGTTVRDESRTYQKCQVIVKAWLRLSQIIMLPFQRFYICSILVYEME